ncbi:hypothetical protein C7C46_13470, partial [Streptomyces tateyamensis]
MSLQSSAPTQPQADDSSAPEWASALDSVVVHADGAVCRRLATGRLPAGSAAPIRIRLTGLPADLDRGSLRATLPAGPPGWRITELRFAAVAEVRDPQELPDLQQRLSAAEHRLQALLQRQRALSTRIAQTAALSAVPPPPSPEAPTHRRAPSQALLALADFVEERLLALQQQAELLREQVAEAEHEQAVLAEQLARASSAAQQTGPVRLRHTALLTLTPDTP